MNFTDIQKAPASHRERQGQTVKKVPSSRHARMDGTHTGKLSAESVRGRKAECAVQRSILSPGGYQGEGISVPRTRAEMGSPWSVALLRHAEAGADGDTVYASVGLCPACWARNSAASSGTSSRSSSLPMSTTWGIRLKKRSYIMGTMYRVMKVA